MSPQGIDELMKQVKAPRPLQGAGERRRHGGMVRDPG